MYFKLLIAKARAAGESVQADDVRRYRTLSLARNESPRLASHQSAAATETACSSLALIRKGTLVTMPSTTAENL